MAGRIALRLAAQPQSEGPTLLAAGWALLRWERLAEAIAALSAAGERLPDALAASGLRCRRALLMARQLGGEGLTLQTDWNAHAQRCEAAEAWDELVRARCEQIAQLNLFNRFVDARALADELGPLVARYGTAAEIARHQYISGVAAAGCTDLDAAQGWLDRALASYTRLRHPAEQARVRFERAWLWLRREQLDRAEADLLAALQTYRRLELPYRVALCQRDLGIVARYRGDYPQSVALHLAARDQFVALGRDDRAAGCDFNLGAIAHMSGLFDLALAVYHRAERSYEALHDTYYALVAARNQALVLCAQGRSAEALTLIDSLLPKQSAIGDQLGVAELQMAQALALSGLGRIEEAANALQATRQLFLQLGNDPAAAECELELAWLLIRQESYEEAVALLRAARKTLEERPAHNWRVRYGLGKVAEALGNHAVALDHYTAAVAVVARLRRRLASEHASSRIFGLASRLHEDALRLAAATDNPELLLALAEQQRGLSLAQQIQTAGSHVANGRRGAEAAARLQTSLRGDGDATPKNETLNAYVDALMRERHRDLTDLSSDIGLDLAQLQSELAESFGANWAVLCPLFLDDALLLVGVTLDGLCIERVPLDAELRGMLDRACQARYRLQVYRDLQRLIDPTSPDWMVLRALGRRLIPDWLQLRLAPDFRLLIVPSGQLHMLPWAALRLDDHWLCERAVIELAPALRHVRVAQQSFDEVPALLVGCASFGDRAAPLPAALASLEIVEAHWRGERKRFMGAEASCAAIHALNRRGELQRFKLIHLASHAQLGGADGLLAHIKLFDDDLLLDEILQLRLDAPLVVLAACEGGAGNVLPGDEVLGLSRALLGAGAATVLANLWPIYDRGTLAMLAPFYQALANNADAASALAHAQRTLIATPLADPEADAILRTPLIWGGFAVTSHGPACRLGRAERA